MTYAHLSENLSDLRIAKGRFSQHAGINSGTIRAGAAKRFAPCRCGENGLCPQPGVAFRERKLERDLLEKAGATKVAQSVVGLLLLHFSDGSRKIKLPIERRPLQRFRGNCNCLGKIALTI